LAASGGDVAGSGWPVIDKIEMGIDQNMLC
jgi:hypothetical protein